MLRVRLQLASAVEYLECSLLLLVTQASDLPVHRIKLFCSLWPTRRLIKTTSSRCCHKQGSLMRCNYRQRLTVINFIAWLNDAPAVIDPKARYWSKIAIFRPNQGVPVGILPYCLVSSSCLLSKRVWNKCVSKTHISPYAQLIPGGVVHGPLKGTKHICNQCFYTGNFWR